MSMYSWKLKDVIMVAIMSVLFGFIYLGTVYSGTFLGTAFAAFGLPPTLVLEFPYGIFFMASTFAIYIIRKPGVAIVTEMLAALLEVLMGNFYGPLVFVMGFAQGLGAEAGFMIFKYKKFNWIAMILASLGAAIISFGLSLFLFGFLELAPGLLVLMCITRLASSVLFTAVISKVLADNLAKTGVLKSYPIGEQFAVKVDE